MAIADRAGAPAHPPEPAYGWVMAGITFVLTGISFGSIGAVGVFLKPIAADMGWSRAEVSLGYTAAFLAAIAGLLWGYLADRYGAKSLAIMGACSISVVTYMLGQHDALWQFYALYFLFGALGHTAFSTPLYSNVGFWFSRNKGLALGVASAGGAVGQAVIPFVARLLISDHGWRTAYEVLGLSYLLLAVPMALLVRNPPMRERLKLSGKQFPDPPPAHGGPPPLPPVQTIAFLSAAVLFCCICMSVPIVHLVPLLTDRGVHPETAASVLVVLMAVGTAGRLCVGRIADLWGGLRTYLTFSLGQTMFVFWFPHVHNLAGLYGLAAAYGLAYSGVMTCILVCVREMVPLRINARGMSIVVLFASSGMGIGGFLGGLLFDMTGGYGWAYAAASMAGMVNLAILSMLFLRIRGQGAAPAAA